MPEESAADVASRAVSACALPPRVVADRNTLRQVTAELARLEQRLSALAPVVTADRRNLARSLQPFYTELSVIAHTGDQRDVLAAIMHIWLELEGRSRDDVVAITAAAEQLFGYAVGTPILTLADRERIVCRLARVQLVWLGPKESSRWFIQLVCKRHNSSEPSTVTILLEDLVHLVQSLAEQQVCIGAEAIEAFAAEPDLSAFERGSIALMLTHALADK